MQKSDRAADRENADAARAVFQQFPRRRVAGRACGKNVIDQQDIFAREPARLFHDKGVFRLPVPSSARSFRLFPRRKDLSQGVFAGDAEDRRGDAREQFRLIVTARPKPRVMHGDRHGEIDFPIAVADKLRRHFAERTRQRGMLP
mgnify:CR=1 FL=1